MKTRSTFGAVVLVTLMLNSTRKILTCSGCAAALVAAACTVNSQAQTNQQEQIMHTMPGAFDQTVKNLAEFERTKEISRLRVAMRAMELSSYPKRGEPPEPERIRRLRAKGWMLLFAAIERQRDPHFDPDDPNQIPMKFSMPPSLNESPEMQKKHEEEDRKNSEKAARCRLQMGLMQIDEHAQLDVERFLKKAYTPSKADQKELDEVFRETGISAARQQKLKALFGEKERR